MENQELNPTPDSTEQAPMDGLFDELRNALSGLGQSTVTSPTPPEQSVILPAPEEPSNPITFQPSSEVSNGASTDSDFWSGNVLGWPTTSPAEEPISYEKPALEGEAFSLDTPFLKQDPLVDQPLLQEPLTPEPGFLEDPFAPITGFPQAPLAPEPIQIASPEAPVEVPSETFPETASDQIFSTPETAQDLSVGDLSVVDPSAGGSSVEEQPVESPIPIPTTLSIDTPPAGPPPPSEDPLNLEDTRLKPAGLVQLACFFPEGRERQARQFTEKLKDLGGKLKSPIKLEEVFVSAWSEGKPDVAGWKKSSSLSGADVMFILIPKKDLDIFKKLVAESEKGGVRIRLVSLEHLMLRTLYPDIMMELERGRP